IAGGQNTSIYTPGYAPPEQEKGYAVQQSDFFALGRTFVYLLTGKEPNNPTIYDYYNNEFRWRSYAPNIAPNLADFLDQLMADKAKHRPANTKLILQDLRKIEKSLSNLQRPSHSRKIPPTLVMPTQAITPKYAGFWNRYWAFIIDIIIMSVFSIIIGIFMENLLRSMGFNLQHYLTILEASLWIFFGTTMWGFFVLLLASFVLLIDPRNFLIPEDMIICAFLLLGTLLRWIYFVGLEWSQLKATIGKMMLGIFVTDLNGDRISFYRANKRYWGKILSALLIYIGFMLAGWTKKKRALHDIIAGTIIVKKL
ncbi:MAG: serine/threonine protein kinase, partial [Moorea sp. SIO2B7]|nr:serine/threonine protein kinase [Moorena sp. SIO2B7]